MHRTVAFAVASFLASSTVASPFAVEVVSYTPGDLPDALTSYTDPSAALGRTNDFNPAFPDFNIPPTIVTPFNATFTTDDLVALGNGGSLVLRLDQPATDALGVHTGVGLTDISYPNGNTGPIATPYTSDRLGGIRVSSDGVNFVELTPDGTLFDVPTNVFADADGAYSENAGSTAADFSQAFFGDLANFNNRDFAGVLTLLDGSAGGTWFDTSGFGPINYVEFFVDTAGQTMIVDGVAATPEPASMLALFAIGGLALVRRSR